MFEDVAVHPNNLFGVKSCIPMSKFFCLCQSSFGVLVQQLSFFIDRDIFAIRHSVCGNFRELMNIHEFSDFLPSNKIPFYSHSFCPLTMSRIC